MAFSQPRPSADTRPLTVQDRREEGAGVSDGGVFGCPCLACADWGIA